MNPLLQLVLSLSLGGSLLALLVLAVCGELALDLFLTPDDLYTITPGLLK